MKIVEEFKPFFNSKIVEEERKYSLELLVIIFVLGLLLNLLASSIFPVLEYSYKKECLFWIFLVVTFICIFLYIYFIIVRPIKNNAEIPIVLFFDEHKKTLSLPKKITVPLQTKKWIPFPILARSDFDKLKDQFLIDYETPDYFLQLSEVFSDLIQYHIFTRYASTHMSSWVPHIDLSTGPFISGYTPNITSKNFSFSELSKITSNRFIRNSNNSSSLYFPDDSEINFPRNGEFCIKNSVFEMSFFIQNSSLMNLGAFKEFGGYTSTWFRELSSDYEITTAYLFILKIDFLLKRSLSRFFGERFFSKFKSKNISIFDLEKWLNNWFSILVDYFKWVDEELIEENCAELKDEIDVKYMTMDEDPKTIMFK